MHILLLAGCSVQPDSSSPKIAEKFVTTSDGIEIYYRVAGSNGDVVMVPNAVYFTDSLDRLANNRRIVTYDPRGRGRSAAVPLDKISLDHMFLDFEAVRQDIGADTVSVIGWSGYGMEMFVYALQNPGRVTRLVQLAPVAARFDPYGGMMMADRQARTDVDEQADYREKLAAGEFEGDPAGQCRAFNAVANPPLLADPADAVLIADVCEFENEHPANLDAYFGKLFEFIIGYDWRDELDEVSIPRLVIHGEKDNIPLEGNIEWVAGQPNARLIIVEDAGHFPHMENEEAVLPAIDKFLSGEFPETAKSYPSE